MSNILSGRKKEVLTVTQFTARLRSRLEETFPDVTVLGEIGNWTAASSGHCYFSLKDEGALVSCVLWKGTRALLGFEPREGLKVEVRARVSVFEKKGQYQLVVDSMKRQGEGDLWQRFLELKARLEREGLFDPARKRPLPAFPRCVGLVTSPTGAAVRDMLTVLERRAPSLPVTIFPAKVQGRGAAAELADAVRRLGDSGLVDVLIVGRGGGSMEDLQEFNDEALARAIVACPIPVVSAVGHEIDFTISDFAADHRAPTPSAAAEVVTAGYVTVRTNISQLGARLGRDIDSRLREVRHRLSGLGASHALRRPELLLREYQQRVDSAGRAIPRLVERQLETARLRLRRVTGSLEGHNPELILQKGYAIVRRAKDGRILRRADMLRRNLPVDIQLHDGTRRAIVTDDTAEDLFQ